MFFVYNKKRIGRLADRPIPEIKFNPINHELKKNVTNV